MCNLIDLNIREKSLNDFDDTISLFKKINKWWWYDSRKINKDQNEYKSDKVK